MKDLSKWSIKKVSQQTAYPTFIYWGAAKSGKTSAALTHDEPLVFDFDKGTYEIGMLPPGVGRKDAARDFPVMDVQGDVSRFIQTFEDMEKDGFFSKQYPGIGTIITDTSTRIYEAIKMEYADERNLQKEGSIFEQKINMQEYGQVKQPLRRIMVKLMHAPYVKVHVMQEALVFKKNVKGVLEVAGTTLKGDVAAIYDASVVVRTFVDDKGKFMGEVVYDRTNTYKAGQIVEEPGWSHWKKFYRKGLQEDPRSMTVMPSQEKTISQKVQELLEDEEVTTLFEQAGIAKERWQESCENYNGDRNMIVSKLVARIDAISNKPE